MVPVCMSMALNLVFLCNIVRVLWVKLQAGPSHLSNSTPSRTLLQAFRATLLLLPLLGLHYLLTPFRPPKQHPWERFYEVVSATTSSFQVYISSLILYTSIHNNDNIITILKHYLNNVITYYDDVLICYYEIL